MRRMVYVFIYKRMKAIKVLFITFMGASLFAIDTELKYDQDTQTIGVYGATCHTYTHFGVRFTPASSCQVKSAKIYSCNQAGPQTCSLYVWDNQSGLPGTQIAQVEYIPIDSGWQIVNLPAQISCSTDFWLGIGTPINVSTYVITDSGLTNPYRMGWKLTEGPWELAADLSLYDAAGDFKIRAIVSYTGIEESELVPVEIALNQNFPNPVTQQATISYVIPQQAKVKLKIYDITGKVVKTLLNNIQSAGVNKVLWDRKNQNGRPVSSGLYFYTLTIGNRSLTKTMIVL